MTDPNVRVSNECKRSSLIVVHNLHSVKERSTLATPIGSVKRYRSASISRGAKLRPIFYKIQKKLEHVFSRKRNSSDIFSLKQEEIEIHSPSTGRVLETYCDRNERKFHEHFCQSERKKSYSHIFKAEEKYSFPTSALISSVSPPLSKTEDNKEKEFFKIKLFDIERRKFHTCFRRLE